MGVDENGALGAVQIGRFDPRMPPVPVAPEESSGARMQGDAARIPDALVLQHFSDVGVAERGHFHRPFPRVGPVQIAGDPVDGHAFRKLHVVAQEGLRVGAVVVGPADGAARRVRPIHPALVAVHVQAGGRHEGLDVDGDASVGRRRVEGDAHQGHALAGHQEVALKDGQCWKKAFFTSSFTIKISALIILFSEIHKNFLFFFFHFFLPCANRWKKLCFLLYFFDFFGKPQFSFKKKYDELWNVSKTRKTILEGCFESIIR